MFKSDIEKDLSPFKKMILEALYKYRGVTAIQLLEILYKDRFKVKPDPKFNKRSINLEVKTGERSTAQKNLAKYLSELFREGFISSDLIDQKRKVYYLSREGFIYIKGQLQIKWNHIGTGYNGDIGDFPYEIVKPPLKNIFHHLLLVDFFVKVIDFSQRFLQQNNFTIDFRDNRYCAEDFKVNSRSHKHRPDAEMRVTNTDSNSQFFYWIEFDRSTEYSGTIFQKFEKYNLYLDYLAKTNRKLPEAILFITDEKDHDRGTRMRWETITEAFFSCMSKWASKVNLIYGTLTEVEDILSNEIAHTQIYEKFVKGKLRYYFQNPAYKGTEFFELGENENLDWELALLSVSHHENYHQVFLYERNHRFETRGYARAISFANFLKEAKKHIKSLQYCRDVIPVFYHFDPDNKIIPVPYKSIAEPKKFANLQQPIWVNVLKDPIWTDAEGIVIKRNPLIPDPTLHTK
ncbi:replication-relaxation family protein [Ammoniphilus resinae]|uniref:Replication-relaxation n=1 Tax=Ammoniphilus resinae TaxID=861532 RepID=A0ABS4GNF5_9BACL|nr:replication-relaxation family protein [Ammoniphilus resinae]MBP1931805.1 hypothetical protein [Ammoniphilus resinae]